jgi:hypothetical protein
VKKEQNGGPRETAAEEGNQSERGTGVVPRKFVFNWRSLLAGDFSAMAADGFQNRLQAVSCDHG